MARGYFRTLSKLSRDEVFRAVRRAAITRKDIASARFRVARHMTGNDRPYAHMLDWIENWLTLSTVAWDQSANAVVDLALPESESYWQKVFEVWTLEQTRSSLARLGWTTESTFRLHAARGKAPLARFQKSGRTVDLYYQTQKPLGTGQWVNVRTKSPLGGIPDVALAREGKAPFLIDAKWRYRTLAHGTSEEQYKMLGYAENFSFSQPAQGFFGILIFPSDTVDAQSFTRTGQTRLTTLRTDLQSSQFAALLDAEFASWLGS